MDSDSDNESITERAIRKKLEKLMRLTRRNSTGAELQDVSAVSRSICNSINHGIDLDETIKVIFPNNAKKKHKAEDDIEEAKDSSSRSSESDSSSSSSDDESSSSSSSSSDSASSFSNFTSSSSESE